MRKILLLVFLSVAANVYAQGITLSCVSAEKGGGVALEVIPNSQDSEGGVVIINSVRKNQASFTKTTITWTETIGDSNFYSVLNRVTGTLGISVSLKSSPNSWQPLPTYNCTQQSRKF